MSDFYWGSSGHLSVAGTDISADTKGVKLSIKRKTAELARLGNSPVAQLVGPYVASVEVELHGSTQNDGIFGAAVLADPAVAKAVILSPFGTTAGLPKYTGDFFIADYEPDVNGDDPLGMSSMAVCDEDGLTRGTW